MEERLWYRAKYGWSVDIDDYIHGEFNVNWKNEESYGMTTFEKIKSMGLERHT